MLYLKHTVLRQGDSDIELEVLVYNEFSVLKRCLSSNEQEIRIPPVLEGTTVTEIGDGCFFNHTELVRVSIPETVTSIGATAFMGCSALQSIDIPDSVLVVGNNAFKACSGLKKIKMSANQRVINWGTFSDCHLNQVEIVWPEHLRIIEPRAFARFYRDSQLDKVIYPGEIADKMNNHTIINSCDMELVIPDTVIEIGQGAFFEGPRVKTMLPDDDLWYKL